MGLLCVSFALWSAVLQSHLAPIMVVIAPEVERIAVGDPLLVKLLVANRSRAALPFNPPLSVWRGNLSLAVKGPGEDRFYGVPLPVTSEPDRPTERGFEAGAEWVSYVYLFRYRSRRDLVPVFAAEGTWQITATVLVGTEYYHSESVTIQVRPCPLKATSAMTICQERLHSLLTHPVTLPSADDLAILSKALPALNGTAAEGLLVRMLKLGDVYLARSDQDCQKGESGWAALRMRSTPVQQEYMDLLLAIAYLERKDYQSVRKQLRNIPSASWLEEYIRHQLGRRDPDR